MNNCPTCNNDLVKVVYGYPTPTMIERAKNEEIALGGCEPLEYPFYCYTCNDTVPPTEYKNITE